MALEIDKDDEDEDLDTYLRNRMLKNLLLTAETYNLNDHSACYIEGRYKVSIYLEKMEN